MRPAVASIATAGNGRATFAMWKSSEMQIAAMTKIAPAKMPPPATMIVIASAAHGIAHRIRAVVSGASKGPRGARSAPSGCAGGGDGRRRRGRGGGSLMADYVARRCQAPPRCLIGA